MKVFVAGATGAIGRPLICQLLAAGHEVSAMARSSDQVDPLRDMAVDAFQADAFDRATVHDGLKRRRPNAAIDELTSLPQDSSQLAQALPADCKLRMEGGGNLLAAAEALGVERYLQQSCGFYLASTRGELADETASMRVDALGGNERQCQHVCRA